MVPHISFKKLKFLICTLGYVNNILLRFRSDFASTRVHVSRPDQPAQSCHVITRSLQNGRLLDFVSAYYQTEPQGYKTFFILNSVEHEILNAHKYKKISRNSAFLGPDKPRMIFFPRTNVKMPTIVGILTFMSRKNFMLSYAEHKKSFITSGPGLVVC